MRSRYSAYAGNLIDYIMTTTHPNSPHHQKDRALWIKDISDFTRNTQFDGLVILHTDISDDGTVGWVTFRAKLTQQGQNASFTEKSRFEKHDGVWKYLSGDQDFDGFVTILSAAGIGLSATPFLDGTNALAKNTLKYLKRVPSSINKGLLNRFLHGKVSPANCKKIWELLKKTIGPFPAPYPA